MTNRLRFLTVVLVLTTACFAQEGFTVQRNGKQKCPGAEAQKIYLSTCAIVQRDFGATHSVAPTITMVLGSYSNEVRFDKQEIRLTKWDRNAFAQGIRNAGLRGRHAGSQGSYGKAGRDVGGYNRRRGTTHKIALQPTGGPRNTALEL